MDAREPALAEAALPREGAPILGPRYLKYLAGMLVLVGLAEKSELLPPVGVGFIVLVLMAGLAGGFFLALRPLADDFQAVASPINYLVPVLAVLVAAGVSLLAPDWRLHAASQLIMGGAVFTSTYVTLEKFLGQERPGHEFLHDGAVIVTLLGAYLAALAGVQNEGARLVLVFVATFVASYESFHRATGGDSRASLYALMVGQVVVAAAFGFLNYQVNDPAHLAAILLVAWYVNRGVGYHILKNALTRGILVEYAIGALICVGLAVSALLNR